MNTFRGWITLDNNDPPAEDETGAGAALFFTALWGGDDTMTGTEFNDELYGGGGDDILISGGADDDADSSEDLCGDEGNDIIRIAGHYGPDTDISGGDGTDTLEIVGGVDVVNLLVPGLAGAMLETDIRQLTAPNEGVLEGIERLTYAAGDASNLLVSVDQRRSWERSAHWRRGRGQLRVQCRRHDCERRPRARLHAQ